MDTTIILNGFNLPAAECELCPGHLKFFPRRALIKHMRWHEKEQGIIKFCSRCPNIFEQPKIEGVPLKNVCPRCVGRKSAATRARGEVRKSWKNMSGKGVEKYQGIRAR